MQLYIIYHPPYAHFLIITFCPTVDRYLRNSTFDKSLEEEEFICYLI